jgi:hypothetical protein
MGLTRIGFMSYLIPNNKAMQNWLDGEFPVLLRTIVESMSREERVPWALSLLTLALGRCDDDLLNEAVSLGKDRSRWAEAYDFHSKVRNASLSKTGISALQYRLADLVTKVIYNGHVKEGGFDEGAAWFVTSAVRRIVLDVDDEEFTKRAWSLLCGNDDPKSPSQP